MLERLRDRLQCGAVVVGEGAGVGRERRVVRKLAGRGRLFEPIEHVTRVGTEAQRFVGHEPGCEAIAGCPTLLRRVLEDAHGRRGLTGHRRRPRATAGHLVVEHAHCGVDLGEPRHCTARGTHLAELRGDLRLEPEAPRQVPGGVVTVERGRGVADQRAPTGDRRA